MYENVIKFFLKYIMPSMDFIMNSYYVFKYKINKKAYRKEMALINRLYESPTNGTSGEVMKEVVNIYEYKKDLLGGALNWNYQDLRAIAATRFKKDCDGFASLAQIAFPGRNRIAIIPKNPFKLHKAHVVYTSFCKYDKRNAVYVFDSGSVRKMNIAQYLSSFYPKNDHYIIEMPDGYEERL